MHGQANIKSAGLSFLLVLAKCLPHHYWFRHRHSRLTMRAVGLWVTRSLSVFIYFSSPTSTCLLALFFEKSVNVNFTCEVKDQCHINKICHSGFRQVLSVPRTNVGSLFGHPGQGVKWIPSKSTENPTMEVYFTLFKENFLPPLPLLLVVGRYKTQTRDLQSDFK